MTEFEKVHRLAVKMAVQGYLDTLLGAEHLQPIGSEDKTVIDTSIAHINSLLGENVT